MRLKKLVPLLVLALFVAPGCGGDDDAVDPLAHYFDAEPYDDVDCDRSALRLEGRHEIRLFAMGDVNVRLQTLGLQRYYRRFGLGFFTKAEPVSIDMPYALDTRVAELTASLTKQFPDVSLTDEEALKKDPGLYNAILRAALNFQARPLIEFAKTHNQGGAHVTNLVVLPRLLPPGSGGSAAAGEAKIAGISVSPDLIQALVEQGKEASQAWKDADFPAEFTPFVLLDGRLIEQTAALDERLPDLVVAHEFGHSGGLVHRFNRGNVMYPRAFIGQSACNDFLETVQIDALRTNLRLGPATVSALHLEESAGTALPARPRAKEITFDLPPDQFVALLHGDQKALRRFLAPILPLDD